MGVNNVFSNSGCDWMLGVAGATRFPTDGQGGATATASSGGLVNVNTVQIVGVLVSVAAAGAITLVDRTSTAIPGLTVTLVAGSLPGWYAFGDDGALYTGGNFGMTLAAGITATLFYRTLQS